MIKNKRGVSIYIAIFCLLLFSSLAFIISSLVATHTETATNYLASEQALHIAEAGNQYAIWYLTNRDQNWTTTETSEKSLGSGKYTLEVYDEVDKKIVISRGYVPGKNNPRAMREVKLEGTFGVKEGTHPIYKYAIYTDSVDTDSGLALIFDASEYNLSTRRLNDGNADVHSNNDILFRNGSGWVVDGYVYSAGEIIKENWTGNPWRRGMQEGVDLICPPYLDDVTRDYYRERAKAQERYYPGDATFTDTDIELGDETKPAIIYVEGKLKIGNVKYYRAGNPQKFGIGTIVSGGGDVTITGSIEPKTTDRCYLALVSFYDTKYLYQKNEPPYYEGSRTLTFFEKKISFDIPENIRISYTDDEKNKKNSGSLTVFDFNGTPTLINNVPMDETGKESYYCDFNTDSLGNPTNPDWYYFKVEIKQDEDDVVIREILGNFIAGEPDDPQHSIRLYKDPSFTQETSAFDNQADVYLQVYGNSPISSIQLSDYSLSAWDRDPIGQENFDSFRRCKFQLPSLTQDYWYNLKVTTTAGTTFYKQIYIMPAEAVPIYVCTHSNNYFRLGCNLEIIGNLTARHGLKISATTPLSRINVIYDTKTFRDPKKTNPNALPGAVSFAYTWKED